MSIQFTMRMMKKISLNFGMTLVPCLVCLILFSQGVTVSAVHAAETRVELTDREKAWLEDHPTISIGNEMDWPPFSFVEEDQPVGFSTDYLKLVATKTGMNIKWVTGYTWKELLKMAENGKIDALHSLSKTEEREKYLGFTPPFYTSSKVIFTRPEDASIQGLEDISDKKIAIIDGFSYENYLKKEFPRMEQIKVANALEGLTAVSMGKADAYIDRQAVCLYFIQKFNVSNVVFATIFKSDNSANDSLFIGIHKNRPELLTIIKKGMNAISDEEINALKNKWFGTTIESKINLTADEKEWIEEHRDIRLGVTSAWPPIEYFQGGAYSGLSAEYVKQLAKDTGLSFAPPPFFDWPDLLPLAQEKELDVLPGVSRTPDREKYLSFSRSYGKFPIVVYQRTDSHPVKSMRELDGKSVAVVSNCIIEKFLRDNHPSIKLQSYTNLKKALLVLSRGKVDALAGNAVAVEYIKQKESLFNVAPAIKTPYVQDLRFGIRNDWEPLVKIIDKWLNQLDETTKDRLTREAGVDLDIPVVAKETKRSVDFTQLLLIGGGIIVVFGISFIILLFIRRFIVSRAETLYSSHQYKIVGIVVGVMFLCLVVVATWYALAQVEKDARYAVGESLESVLLTTHDALSIWSDQNKIYIKELAAMPFMRGLTEALLSLPEDKAVIEASPQLWNIRKLMVKAQESRKIIGFAIISKNYLNYASKHDSNILDKNIISIQRPRLMDKVFLGDTIFIPPVQAEGTDLGDSYEEVMTGVAFATPIKASDGKVIAILAIYYDVDENYQRIISLGRIGGTGETYTFDKNGILTSESRFDDLLKELGLIEKDQRGLLNLHLFDPGGNLLEGHILNTKERLPLTFMAESATAEKAGRNLDGYRDYRGVQVYGLWLWDSDLDLGIATEIDVSEALGSYHLVRNTVITIILITIMLGSLITGLSNWIGQSAAKSLSRAKDELEDRVEERTAELKKISVAVEQSSATVVITDIEGTIQYVNPQFTKMTGYTEEEAIGQNPRVLKSGTHPTEFYKELWSTILQGNIWTGDFLNRKKSGELFWERASIAPIFNDDAELTHFVAVKEDITDRKAQEERFQALLDAAPDAMISIAQDGEIMLVNIATEKLFGFTRKEMIGQKVEMLLPEYIREGHPQHRDKIFAAPDDMDIITSKEFYGQTKTGNKVPVDISLNPIDTDDGTQIIASIRNITERKKAEAAIAESEERTRLILSSAGEGIFGVNLKGNVVFINEAACSMVGYMSEELMGKGVLDIIHHSRPDGSFYPAHESPIHHAFMEGLSSRVDDEVLWRKDGTCFPVEYTAVPIRRGAEMIGAVISFQDITERKEMQHALMAEKDKTEDALSVITSSIQYASRIQRSMLPSNGRIEQFTSEHFVVWEPRDVVGGDIYWCEPWGSGSMIILGDCTGHGVPGAFMTLISTGALERALLDVKEGDAATLISQMHQLMQAQLGQKTATNSHRGSDDGLELGLCYISPERKSITYSGARMQLFIDHDGSITAVKGNKKGIAYRGIPFDFTYTNREIKVLDGMRFFMTTDGLIDQIGGEKHRGFGKKRFLALLESLRSTPLQTQGEKIYAQLEIYQGKEKRRDDVSLIGFSL